ncbi:hypothetical protein [Candidatus Palauibacter sp.]
MTKLKYSKYELDAPDDREFRTNQGMVSAVPASPWITNLRHSRRAA